MRAIVAAVTVGFVFLLAGACFAQVIPSADLISRSKDFDDISLEYSGEVIGDVMQRGEYAWINVNDGVNAIGIWIPASMANNIKATGDFKHTGDRVQITGIFHRVCGEHGGDLDIHAKELRIVQSGGQKECNIYKGKRDWTLKLLGVLAIIWILSLLKMR
jgi:hypothetical protein